MAKNKIASFLILISTVMFGVYYQNFIELAEFMKQTHKSALTSGGETNHYLWMCKLIFIT